MNGIENVTGSEQHAFVKAINQKTGKHKIQGESNSLVNSYENKVVEEAISQSTSTHKIEAPQDGPNPLENTYENKKDDAAAAEIKHSGRIYLSETQEKVKIAGDAKTLAQKFMDALARIKKKTEENRELAERMLERQLNDPIRQMLREQMKYNFTEINSIVASTNIDGNLPLGPEGKPITISLDDQTNITIPAQDFSIGIDNLNSTPKNVRDTIRDAIKAINDYDGFMIGVHDKIEKFSTQMQFELKDILKVEEQISQLNDILELSAFTIRRVRQDAAKALRGQANIEPEKALALLQ